MKEMLKSKTIIIFIVFMLSVTFIGSKQAQLEDSRSTREYLVYNMQ